MSADPRRIAITGCSGFVGQWLRRRIEQESSDVVLPILSRAGQDIRDAKAAADAIQSARPDVVIHLAAIAAPLQAREAPAEAWDVNVLGTLNLATAVKRYAPIARLLYIGSSEAYGASFTHTTGPIREDAVLEPRSVYGSTKAVADLLVGQLAQEGLRALRLRPFNHTGPGQSADYVVSSFARQIALIEQGKQEPVIQVGNLEAERDFLDVRDVVDAYLAASKEVVHADGSAINIATGHPVKIADILTALLAIASVPIRVEVDPGRFRANDVPRASGSIERAASILNWRPTIDLAVTLQDTLDYWRQQAG